MLLVECVCVRGSRLVAQDKRVAHGQDIPFGGVFDLPQGSVRTHQLELALLLALLQKRPPKVRHLRLEAGRRKVVHLMADDLFPGKPQQLAGAGTGVPIVAVVVGDQDGCGRLIDNRAEKQLKFFRTVLDKPTAG